MKPGEEELGDEAGTPEAGAPTEADAAPAEEAAALGEDGDETTAPSEQALPEAVPVATAEELVPADEAPAEAGGLPMVGIGGGLIFLLILAVVAKTALGGPKTPQIPASDTAQLDTEPEADDHTAEVEAAPENLVSRFARALGRSREALQGRFDTLFGAGKVDESLFEELEEVMLKADVGLPTTERLLAPLREMASKDSEASELREALRAQVRGLLLEHDPALLPAPAEGPWVLLVVGVNGSGKTTTIGKLAARFKAEGRKVLLAAADTYRAAAADQLKVWAERAEVDIVAHDEGSDPGAVVYDALEAAKARGKDVVIVDTAGRLQTARPLMEQLGKIRRVIDKKVPGAPHETLLVLDGTMGQNGLSQAKLFNEATPLTGAVVTKLDGTAKGGMVLTLSAELELPVKFIGIGEGIDDLKPFDAEAFAEALA
ncbi:MAG: signal recognition particle-docking protein FtsY [Deltaproteobacteria bacterium]|nr:MAG: signal recognition particle-docking protein FtsY [Deltaproteobacteria bacterium]